MNLRTYLEIMNKIAQENPKALDFDVVYAEDDEGNNFRKTGYGPMVGHFDGDSFSSSSDRKSNSVCLN